MKTLTVFTPTYNRAYCLDQLYNSLVKQTNQDFEWLIVDDGSSDTTNSIVQLWIDENKIDIKYIYQENQGMHGAHNTAYNNITTDFNVCIDSDDYMPLDAVAIILKHTEHLDVQFAGIVGLDADKKGTIIGTTIPKHLVECTLNGLYENYGVTGDKKLVYRTDVVKKYPKYPIFKGENFVPLGYLYNLIDKDYLLKPINEVLVIVEYQEDGSTKNILRQYRKNPKGFAFARIEQMRFSSNVVSNIKNAIHIDSSILLSKEVSVFKQSNSKLLLLIVFPLGLILYFYILFKTQK